MLMKFRNVVFILLAILSVLGCGFEEDNDWQNPVVKANQPPQEFPDPHGHNPAQPAVEDHSPPPPPPPQHPVGQKWTSRGGIKHLVPVKADGKIDWDNIVPAEIQMLGGGERIKPLLHPLFWAIHDVTPHKIILTSALPTCSPHRFSDAETQLDHWGWWEDDTSLVLLDYYDDCPNQLYASSMSNANYGWIKLSANVRNREVLERIDGGPRNSVLAQVARDGDELLVIRYRDAFGPNFDYSKDPDFANHAEFCEDRVSDPQDHVTFDECMDEIEARWRETEHAQDYPLPVNLVVTNPFMEEVFGGRQEVRTRMRRIPQKQSNSNPLGLQVEHPPNSNQWYWLDRYVEWTFVNSDFQLYTRLVDGFPDINTDKVQATPFILTWEDKPIMDGHLQEVLYDADPLGVHPERDRGLLWKRHYRAKTAQGGNLLFWFDVGRNFGERE